MELQIVQNRIFQIRGVRVMLDEDIALLYGIETRILKQAVRRNINRFPADFMFELSKREQMSLRSQIVTLKTGRGQHTKYSPFAFTEQGVAMLSSVLKSKKAIEVNISIIRAFVLLRQHLSDYTGLKAEIAKLEQEMNRKFKDINEVLHYLLNPKSETIEIGFKQIGRKTK
jgi:phage regulator Rha-like protein